MAVNIWKKCSKSLDIREIWEKISFRSHPTQESLSLSKQTIINAAENVE